VEKYDPSAIEPQWQRIWDDAGLFTARHEDGKPKRYILNMFPYPSGKLHMGHVMNYTIGDVIVRYSLMQGYSVLSPIGWDSFGLPAENAAIREGIHPSKNIKVNIDTMREQMKRAGWGFDWKREVSTSAEEYYRWTQWLFLKFYKAGLVRKKKAPVNWCPNDMTVLANEQVHDGRCERCGTTVEQRDLEQWFFLMSAYAEKLLGNLDKLTKWPERVIKMQREWIGKSEGAKIEFVLEGTTRKIPVFTTRPDTLWGVTFLSMAAQHPLVDELIREQPNRDEILAAVRRMRQQGTSEIDIASREKEGVFTGRYVINPVNGDRVPLWIANFVVMNYGTGVVMAVPAHDQRDFEFATKHSIPIKIVIQPPASGLDAATMTVAYVDDGIMVESADFSGRNNREAMSDIIKWLKERQFGDGTVSYRLRDWLLSRQRYWGAPIPIVYCEKCGEVAVPAEQLPVRLPPNVEFKPTGESPLKRCPEFMATTCPQCGGAATRDADTMDTFVDSSWYYLRYTSPDCTTAPFDRSEVHHWCPVDIYIGGIEHATMHLIYFRFFNQVLHDLGMIDFEEPVDMLFCQGMVCSTAYYCETDKWLPAEKVDNGACTICGAPARSEITKMSKTKLNVVSPEEIIGRYGADTMRMYILSDNPPDRDQLWNENGVLGVSRFLNRLWDTFEEALPRLHMQPAQPSGYSVDDKELRRSAHNALQKGIQAIESNWQFNTAIARIIELLAAIRKVTATASPMALRECCEILIKLLAPITPHISEELWRRLGHTESIFCSPLPVVDAAALASDEVTIVVQVNGKLRGTFPIAAGANAADCEKAALQVEKIQPHLAGKTVRKVIVVPGKLVNIVVG
jgi:leucyl-tRNA synthetase